MIRFFPLILLAACTVPPAWEPGDPPLTFTVDSDRTGELILAGCALWADAGIGLECRLVERGGTVSAWREELDEYGRNVRGYSRSRPCGFLWTDRWYAIRFDPVIYAYLDADVLAPELADAALVDAAALAAHEIGHMLGVWDHVPASAIMDPDTTADAVTPADVRALPWAEGL